MADNTQDTIVLHTNDGSMGYRIVKFELIPNDPGGVAAEHIVQVFKIEQTTMSNDINFADNTLIAAGYVSNATSGDSSPPRQTIVFDNEVFNQDIYITHEERKDVSSCNYYLELEVIPLTDHAAEYTTLKDIRAQLKIS